MTTRYATQKDFRYGHCDSCDRRVPRSSMRGDPDRWMGCGRCAIRCGCCYFLDNQCARCRAECDENEREGRAEIEDT